MPVFGGMECGGTKFVCATGTAAGELLSRAEFPTTSPAETLGRALEFFKSTPGELASIGIGSFGPVDLNPSSPKYGYITSTPKPGWRDTEVAGLLHREIGVPVGFDTDVNAAALGEARWGAARGLDTFIYLTVGTGLGGGGMANGRLIHGLLHPEMGHIRVPHDRSADPYPGCCPYHGDCLEGLVCGPALQARWGQRGETLPADHPAWELEAHYLALALVNFICTLSPKCIILGGGVMHQSGLLDNIRAKVAALINGYLDAPPIVPPALGGNAGVLGSLALGMSCEAAP